MNIKRRNPDCGGNIQASRPTATSAYHQLMMQIKHLPLRKRYLHATDTFQPQAQQSEAPGTQTTYTLTKMRTSQRGFLPRHEQPAGKPDTAACFHLLAMHSAADAAVWRAQRRRVQVGGSPQHLARRAYLRQLLVVRAAYNLSGACHAVCC